MPVSMNWGPFFGFPCSKSPIGPLGSGSSRMGHAGARVSTSGIVVLALGRCLLSKVDPMVRQYGPPILNPCNTKITAF